MVHFDGGKLRHPRPRIGQKRQHDQRHRQRRYDAEQRPHPIVAAFTLCLLCDRLDFGKLACSGGDHPHAGLR